TRRTPEPASGPAPEPAAGPDAPARRRSGLALRIALATTAVALLTGVLTGAIFLRLVGGAADEQARRAPGRQADPVVRAADRPATARLWAGVLRTLAAQQITLVRIDGDGTVTSSLGPRGGRGLVLPADVLTRIAAGSPVGETRTTGGRRVNVAGRPLPAGGA